MKTLKIPKSKFEEIIRESVRSALLWEHYDDFDKYRRGNEEEMDDFHVMRKKLTGLPVNIFIDNAYSYQYGKHQLWMYFQNDYYDKAPNNNGNLLPISVESNPKLLVNPSMLKISESDLNILIKFVKLNRVILVKMANMKIDDRVFYRNMDANRSKLKESVDRMLLTEMAKTIGGNITGLPVTIWLDETQQYLRGGHGPRIKFHAVKGEQPNTHNNFGSMSISDNPEVMSIPRNANISSWEIELIKKFVIYNKDLLLKLINNEIDYKTQFLPNMIIIGKRGEPIYPQQENNGL
jgi:hypothetical protein